MLQCSDSMLQQHYILFLITNSILQEYFKNNTNALHSSNSIHPNTPQYYIIVCYINTPPILHLLCQYCVNTASILQQYVNNITKIRQCYVVLLLNTTIFNTAAILPQYYPNITSIDSILHIVFQYYRNTTSIQHCCHFNITTTHFNTTRVPIQLNTTNTTQYYTQAQ